MHAFLKMLILLVNIAAPFCMLLTGSFHRGKFGVLLHLQVEVVRHVGRRRDQVHFVAEDESRVQVVDVVYDHFEIWLDQSRQISEANVKLL
jgi:hypothetical protein